jgi:hypothetical protein
MSFAITLSDVQWELVADLLTRPVGAARRR